MLDHKSLKELEDYMKVEDAQREQLIIRSRSVLKNSKAAIYSIHRKDLKEAVKYLDESKKVISELKKIVQKYPHLVQHMDNALEEYCEACVLLGFVKGKLPSYTDLDVDPVTYLCGLSDLTGELGRRAVHAATAKDKPEVKRIRDLVDEIHGAMIKFDFRNGDLRKKSDAIKWNLQKVEELLYDLGRK